MSLSSLVADLATRIGVEIKAVRSEVTIGLSGKQTADSDLTTIAGLTATTDSFLQAKSSAWAARTIAQVKSDLAVPTAPSDIGAQPVDSDLTTIAGLTATTDGILQSKASAWSVRTPAQVKADLAITAADVGAQPVDSDLTTIAGLTATTDSFLQSKASAWTTRTIAQVKSDLAVPSAASDIGAQPVDSDLTAIAALAATTDNFLQAKASAWASRTPTQVAADLVTPLSTSLQPIDSDLTAIAALTPTNDDVVQRKAGAWANRTMAQLKADLAVTAADVGAQAADADLTTLAGLVATTDNIIQSVAGAWASRTPAQVKTALAIAEADVSGLVADLALKAPLANPTFTGLVTCVREIRTPQTQSVTTTLAIDAATGDNHQITATGNPAMGVPSNGTNGQTLVVEILASGGARTVTLNASIVLSSGQAATYIIGSGKVGIIILRYSGLSGNVWICTAMTQEL